MAIFWDIKFGGVHPREDQEKWEVSEIHQDITQRMKHFNWNISTGIQYSSSGAN